MAARIFINYRRDDERSTAARIRDRLAGVFGAANVFMDVDNLLAGQRFDKELEKALAEADVFLAVIGPKWMDLFTERQAAGDRDYVRDEIAGALKRGIIVIPALIERTPLPRADALPDDIRELVLHQKHDIGHERFGRDVEALVTAIRLVRRRSRWARLRALLSRLFSGPSTEVMRQFRERVGEPEPVSRPNVDHSMREIVREIPHSIDQTCQHPGCAAFRRMKENGARMQLRSGRGCEIAMLAAAGPEGLSDQELVQARLHLFGHLNIPPGGDSDHAVHAVHADHAAQGPGVNDPIHTGRCRVIKTSGVLDVRRNTDHYVLEFPAVMRAVATLESARSWSDVIPQPVETTSDEFRRTVRQFEDAALMINPRAGQRARSVALFKYGALSGWTAGQLLQAHMDFMVNRNTGGPYDQGLAISCCTLTLADADTYDLRGKF